MPQNTTSECSPKRNIAQTIWAHFKSWPEFWLGLPLATLSIPTASAGIYFMTHRWPEENMNYLLDLASRVQTGALIIFCASFVRQTQGVWLTKEEKFAHPYYATLQFLSRVFSFIFFGWLFTR